MTDESFQGNKKKNVKRKYFVLSDLLLVAIVVCAVLLVSFTSFFGNSTDDLTVVVSVGGKTFREIPLSQVQEPYTLVVEGYESEKAELYVTSESVEFIHSPCPDKLCVNTGKLTKNGQSAVCLPLRISVELVGSNSERSGSLPDVIVG